MTTTTSPLLLSKGPKTNYSTPDDNLFLKRQQKNQIDGLTQAIANLTAQLPVLKNRAFCVEGDTKTLSTFETSEWNTFKVTQDHLAYIQLPGVQVGDRFTRDIFSSMLNGQKKELSQLEKVPAQIRSLKTQLESLQRVCF